MTASPRLWDNPGMYPPPSHNGIWQVFDESGEPVKMRAYSDGIPDHILPHIEPGWDVGRFFGRYCVFTGERPEEFPGVRGGYSCLVLVPCEDAQ